VGAGGMSEAPMTPIDRKIAALGPQRFVNSVFERVASKYDLMNDLMSAGIHRLWKNAMIDWAAPSPTRPTLLLDVAGGTGDIAARFLRCAGPGSMAIIYDINASMLEEGRRRLSGEGFGDRVRFVQGNAEDLAIASNSIQLYTIAFGIRNVPSLKKALDEAHRVLKPGGRFLCLEFSRVSVPILDAFYERYSDTVMPALGQLVAGDAEPYRYLVESIRKFPDQTAFARMIEQAGFVRVQYRNLSGGIAALHSGIKA
jgi:demethylmenaquinone methyltransferase/2-methoxy-6-polyprenyl-1,4-benzoquinol methylase